MSETYGFALVGALIFAVIFAPVLASWIRRERIRSTPTRVVSWLSRGYTRMLAWVLAHRKTTLAIAGAALVFTLALGTGIGGEFMPKLEEGNLWVRATLPQDASYEGGAQMAHDIREILLEAIRRSPKSYRRWAGRTMGPTSPRSTTSSSWSR
jgi:cobalt-zinc-cadmium resistance protein CzcA